MIQISRVTNPADTQDIIPMLPLETDEGRALFAQQLAQVMIHRPETVLVLAARSDVNGLVGFVIAELAQLEVVNLRQAWVSPKVTWDVGTELNARVKLWAVGHGRTQIEVRTTRSAEAMYRRFGFEESAKILVQSIPEEFTQGLISTLKEPAHE